MLLTIAYLLGIPLWILLGWLAAGIWHRHENKDFPGVFKIKVRVVSGEYRHVGNKFPRMSGQAIWAHDVLILEKGLLIPRTMHFKIADDVKPTRPADLEQIKGLGDSPVTLQFQIDEGAVVEIAAPGEQSELAQGPFSSASSPAAVRA